MPAVARTFFTAVCQVVKAVPRGRVVTYGQVAVMAGRPGAARAVGWSMHTLPDGSKVPWHRVINSRGAISPRGEGLSEDIQRHLLQREGIRFNRHGRVDLESYQWDGSRRRTRAGK